MKRCTILCILLILALSACSTALPQGTPTASEVPATATSIATSTSTATATATETPSPTPTITPIPLPVEYGPDDFPDGINPLTGLSVADGKLLERRPVAVKINLVPRTSNRPPWGVTFADIVFDYYHNNGYSRLFAIFYGQNAELVGPIRSGRLLDTDLVQMYKTIFAYGSADALINQRLLNASYSPQLILEGQRSNCPPTAEHPLCRFEPQGYDFLLASSAALSQFATAQKISNERQDLKGMLFNSLTPAGGEAASQATVRYSGDDYVRWEYHAASGTYLRLQDNQYDQGQGEAFAPLIDRLNNEQVRAENVVILIAPHNSFQAPPNEIIEIVLSGTGPAYALRDGQIFKLTWNRPTVSSVLYLTFPDGTRYAYKPGATWYQVVGTYSKITEPEKGSWRFDHRMP